MTQQVSKQIRLPFNPTARSEAMVIHCSDHKYQSAFDYFVASRGIRYPARIIIPGGAHDFTAKRRSHTFDDVRDRANFIIKELTPVMAVIIGHQECQWYKKHRPEQSQEFRELKTRQHLTRLAEVVRSLEKRLTIECYMAEIVGGHITFNPFLG